MTEDRYIIYGADRQGKGCYEFLKNQGLSAYIIGFCDKRHKEIQSVYDKKVYSYQEAKELGAKFIIAVAVGAEEICDMLDADGREYCALDELAHLVNKNKVEFNREYCAFFHIDNMDAYFEDAETELDGFWNAETEFYRLFSQLDLTNVIELACGRGRHVKQYIDKAGRITLVDILQKNIDFCRSRFSDVSNISYYCNDGYNLKELKSGEYTALFSYDAMVHFELIDIYEYLVDIYRVLVPGGKALIHHSNNDEDYKASFEYSKKGRNFMSKKIFAHLAYRAGFTVVEQQVIDWGYKDLDCITLLEKVN